MKEKYKKIVVIAGSVIVAVLIILIIAVVDKKKADASQKEAPVSKEITATGVIETGSVDVGTMTQSFDLDISEFTGTTSFSFGGGSMGGNPMGGDTAGGMPGGIFSSDTSSSSDTRTLEIEEVYVEAGQEIKEGDAILRLTQDTVDSIRTELTEDVASAKIAYEQALTSHSQVEVEAQSSFDINTLYGTYSQSEYNQQIKKLEENVTEKEDALTQAQEDLAQAQEDLTQKQELLPEHEQVLKNAQFTADGTSQDESLYWWIIAWQTKEDAQTMLDTLKDEIEQLNENIEQYTDTIADATISLALAKKELEAGTIEADAQLNLRSYYAENAQEIYDASILQSNFSSETARSDYEEAQAKLTAFDEAITEQKIYTDYSGLITEVAVSEGDALSQDMVLIILNDYESVTITLSIEEVDMQAATLGKQVHVTVAAFPEVIFEGEVTEIGDAQIDSNTNKTLYSVTVTVNNTDNLLYQDMTAEVTFQ